MRRVSVLLITMALIAGMVACTEPVTEPHIQYDLTISSSEGGAVATPGEGTFTYDSGTVVSLLAEAGAGYQFVNWIGDVGTLADANAALTTITMDGDYSVTASFVAVHSLTIASTAGGTVTTPGEGDFACETGAVVNLVAEPEEGYGFVNWTGDVGTIADVNAATTTIMMNGNYSVTAMFQIHVVPVITFAVAGPMAFVYGMDHWAGAEMARDEVNAAGGVSVGGVRHDITLVKVETNEILDATGGNYGREALLGVIDDVHFLVGGFRTESLIEYREVAMGPQGAGKVFMNCGAATAVLQESVIEDYENYKYWFKVWPYNEVFLITGMLRYTEAIHEHLRVALGAPEYQLRAAILMEDAGWSNTMEPFAVASLEKMGFELVGKKAWKCGSLDRDLEPQLSEIAAHDPHMIFAMLSGPPGTAYGIQQADFVPHAFSLGINLEAQHIGYRDRTGAGYHMTLDIWAELVEITPTALDFFSGFVAETGRYPTYCATTYDAIYLLKEAIEAVSAANGWDDIADVIDHANIDALIQHLETTPRTGSGGTTGYYPMPGTLVNGTPALTLEQVQALYPHVVESDPGPGQWLYDPAEWTVPGGFVAHDTVYGPGWQTGLGVQWQPTDPENPEGEWRKVAVWPMEVGAPLVDKYGDWNFAYPGTQELAIPPGWISHHGS